MPKQLKLPVEEILSLSHKHQNDVIENINKPTATIWEKMSREVDGKISARHLYTNIKCNRYNCCQLLNINSDRNYKKRKYSSDSDIEKISNCVTYHFVIDSINWKKIEPADIVYKDRRSRIILKKGWIFEQDISNAVKSNCSWRFKNHQIYVSGDRYLTILADCVECGATLFAHNCGEPTAECELFITLEIANMDPDKHKGTIKRKLTGDKRDEIGKSLNDFKLAINWRRAEAYKLGKEVQLEPSKLYNLPVLRKCKQEFADKKYINFEANNSPIDNLHLLKYTQPYKASFHSLSLDKFYFHYSTPEQILVCNSYVTTNKRKSLLTIDATGNLVQKLRRPCNNTSGHIFLYAGIIHVGDNYGQILVCQMLSEAHDTATITYWLENWIKLGAQTPHTIVCDHSVALLGAISWAFLQMTLKSCIEVSFDILQERNGLESLRCTYIRVDYAHVMKIISKWESIRKLTLLHEFYMRTMVLLIKADCLETAQDLIENILIVANSQYTGTLNGIPTPCEVHKRRLKFLISGLDTVEIVDENDKNCSKDPNLEENLMYSEYRPANVQQWFEEIRKKSLLQCNFVTEDENH